jgi:hypothetical protein
MEPEIGSELASSADDDFRPSDGKTLFHADPGADLGTKPLEGMRRLGGDEPPRPRPLPPAAVEPRDLRNTIHDGQEPKQHREPAHQPVDEDHGVTKLAGLAAAL